MNVCRITYTFLTVSALLACSGARDTELDDVVPVPAGEPASPTEPATEPSGGGGGSSASGNKGNGNGNGNGNGGANKGGGGGKGDPKPGGDVTLCDDGIALASSDPYDAAKALGLCTTIAPAAAGWGVIEARWIRPDGTPLASPESYGILAKLGANVLAPSGKRMLAISTGAARAPGDPGYVAPTGNAHDKGYTHAAPPGQPKPSSVCPADATPGEPHDGVALELKVRTPADAKSLSLVHQLFTSDYGDYVCSKFNDAFVVMMDPKPADTDGNIVVDGAGDLLGVNTSSLLRVCTPGTHNGLTFACPLGPASLVGTGFDGKAATGWLRTTAPVTGGSVVTLRIAVWDSGDGLGDTTVLLDDLSFSPTPATVTRTAPR
jgi:hypothetical protein